MSLVGVRGSRVFRASPRVFARAHAPRRPGGRKVKHSGAVFGQKTGEEAHAWGRGKGFVCEVGERVCVSASTHARPPRLPISLSSLPHWLDTAALNLAHGVRGGTRGQGGRWGGNNTHRSHAIASVFASPPRQNGPSFRQPTHHTRDSARGRSSSTHTHLPFPHHSSPLPDAPHDPSLREITVTCPDATGAACDVARCLLDCGLRLVRGDVSVDGRWCYMVLTVAAPAPDFDARGGSSSRRGAAASLWPLVKARLDAVVPRVGDVGGAAASAGLPALRGGGLPAPPAADASSPSLPASASTFTVRVQTVDRAGVLHAIVDALWDADLTVLAASVGGGGGEGATGLSVDDTFIVTDNRATVTAGGASSSSVSASARGLREAASAATPTDDSGSICLPSPSRVADVEAAVRAAVDGAACRVAIVSSPTPPSPASAAAVVPPPTESDRSLPRRCAATAASCSLAAAAAARRAPAADASTTPPPLLRSWSLDGDDDALESVGGRAVPQEAGGGWSADGWAGARGGVRVDVDNTTARAYTVLTVVSVGWWVVVVVCGKEEQARESRRLTFFLPSFPQAAPDRKGLFYDLARVLKDVAVRVAYARVETAPAASDRAAVAPSADRWALAPPLASRGGAAGAQIDLFVCDADGGGRVTDDDLVAELVARVKRAAGLPLRIELRGCDGEGGEGGDASAPTPHPPPRAELTVTAPVDAGGRGRPRVTADVTAALGALGLDVVSADVFVAPDSGGVGGLDLHHADRTARGPSPPRRPGAPPCEVHRFVVADGRGAGVLASADARRAVFDGVRGALTGVDGGGGGGSDASPAPPPAPPAASPPSQTHTLPPRAPSPARALWRWG